MKARCGLSCPSPHRSVLRAYHASCRALINWLMRGRDGYPRGISSYRGPSLPRDVHRRDRVRRDDHRSMRFLRRRRGRPSDGQRKRMTRSVTADDAAACVVTPPGACIIHAGIQPACPAGLDARHVLTAASDVGDTLRLAQVTCTCTSTCAGTTTCGAARPTLHTDDACTSGARTAVFDGAARPSSARISRSAPTITRLRRAGRGDAPRPPRRRPWVQR